MIPRTFEEWKNCIVNDCKVNLTKEFAEQRIAIYQNLNNKETMVFISLYGEAYLQNIIQWYKKSIAS